MNLIYLHVFRSYSDYSVVDAVMVLNDDIVVIEQIHRRLCVPQLLAQLSIALLR